MPGGQRFLRAGREKPAEKDSFGGFGASGAALCVAACPIRPVRFMKRYPLPG